ncbi:MAG: DUF1501 domain-containing protein [Verrucomicrobia bacterium]|nr:MAG: DUF1501 domain-containing protein [Verrucomicrobiota bacterium]
MNPRPADPDLARAIHRDTLLQVSRRTFLTRSAAGLGSVWLAQRGFAAAGSVARDPARPAAASPPLFPGRAKRVIYLHMAGAPSQLELFDYKPELARLNDRDCPKAFLEGKRFAFIRGIPQLLGPQYPFHRERRTGQWISDRLPHLEQMLHRVCLVKSMTTDQFNHAPAQLMAHTGSQNLGAASVGSWVLYGLGSENENMPGFVVLLSGGQNPDAGKNVWGSGFLPGVYQGVQCRGEGDPVLYLSDPAGVNRELRGGVVDAVKRINQRAYQRVGDPETVTRIAQYEMAFRMQLAASEALDISREPDAVHRRYGTQPGRESFANNCLLARRLVERGVRYVQLFDWGWDQHSGLDTEFPKKCRGLDQPAAALLADLEERGLLDETLVVWGGEFGRTPMQENRGGVKARSPGRDHHPFAFTIWLAGGGVKGGTSYGATDELGFQVVENPVQTQDLHATLLHALGFQHEKLTYPVAGGLNTRLTTVTKKATVLRDIFA